VTFLLSFLIAAIDSREGTAYADSGFVEDENGDGIPDKAVERVISVTNGGNLSTPCSRPFEHRGIVKVNISSLEPDTLVQSATITMTPTLIGGSGFSINLIAYQTDTDRIVTADFDSPGLLVDTVPSPL
jgi:hypothetical protein